METAMIFIKGCALKILKTNPFDPHKKEIAKFSRAKEELGLFIKSN
jgi:hypothetical protein